VRLINFAKSKSLFSGFLLLSIARFRFFYEPCRLQCIIIQIIIISRFFMYLIDLNAEKFKILKNFKTTKTSS
jgi:hypothetical protein